MWISHLAIQIKPKSKLRGVDCNWLRIQQGARPASRQKLVVENKLQRNSRKYQNGRFVIAFEIGVEKTKH